MPHCTGKEIHGALKIKEVIKGIKKENVLSITIRHVH